MLEFLFAMALFVSALIGLNFLIRTAVFSTLKLFGAYDPIWDTKWPRFPWRPFWMFRVKVGDWSSLNFGSGVATAGMASSITQLAMLWHIHTNVIGSVRLPLGIPHYSLVGEKSERHEFYIAAARSGKSLQIQVKLALMPEDACAFVIDPKADHLHDVGYALERRGHEICVLDPLLLSKRNTQQINWIKQIDFINERVGDDRTTMICDRIASIAFPPSEEGGGSGKFFTDVSRRAYAAFIYFAKKTIADANMIDVRRLFTIGYLDQADGDPELGMTMVFEHMKECTDDDGYASKVGAQFLAMDDRTRESVLATLRSRTDFWDHEQIKRVSRGNDVNLCDLKSPNKNLILFIPAPVGDMKTTLRSWIGATTSLALAVMEWIPGDLKTKTRFIIEEAQAIGGDTLPGLGDKAALLAGYGVSLTLVAQDYFGFKKSFPKDYGSIIGNAQHVIYMACNEHTTYQHIADDVLGRCTKRRKKWRIPFLWTVAEWQEQVMDADRVRRTLDSDKGLAIVARNGKRPLLLRIAKSFNTLPVWRIDPSRDHGESRPRAWFRAIWKHHTKPVASPSPSRVRTNSPR